MKKYSWLAILVFTMAFITCMLILSKNEAVRDVFMKAGEEPGLFCALAVRNAEAIFCVKM